MMKEHPKNFFLYNRSVILYLALALVLFLGVDYETLKNQNMRYLAWLYAAGGYQNYKDCVLYYDTVTKEYPSDAASLAQLGVCYYKLGDERNAIEAYSKAIALDPRYKLETGLE